MKTKNILTAALMIALNLPFMTQASSQNESLTGDIGLEQCYNKYRRAGAPSMASGEIQVAFRMTLGREIAQCLYDEGFTLKVNRQLDSAEIIWQLGYVSLDNQNRFNEQVLSLVKRPQ